MSQPVTWGSPHAERADAARYRISDLSTTSTARVKAGKPQKLS